MKHPTGASSTLASSPSVKSSKQTIQPIFPTLAKLPSTPEELFRSLALSVSSSIMQVQASDKTAPKKHDYVLPWAGFESWRNARARLIHFEKNFKGKVTWVPLNDSPSNDGPMSL